MNGWAAAAQAATNLNIAGINNYHNRKNAKKANEHNAFMWNMSNLYNHPSNQMARLKSAGLNPHLIYGSSPSGAAGNSDMPHKAEIPKFHVPNPLSNIDAWARLKNVEANTDKTKAMEDVAKQEVILKTMQSANEFWKGSKTQTDAKLAKGLYQYSIDAAAENLRGLKTKNASLDLDYQMKDKSFNDRLQMIKDQALFAKSQLYGQNLINKLRSLEINLNELGIQKTDNLFFRWFGQSWKELKKQYEDYYNNPENKGTRTSIFGVRH